MHPKWHLESYAKFLDSLKKKPNSVKRKSNDYDISKEESLVFICLGIIVGIKKFFFISSALSLLYSSAYFLIFFQSLILTFILNHKSLPLGLHLLSK